MTRSQPATVNGKRSAGNDRGAVDMPMGGGGGRQGCVVYEARLSEQGERASIVHPLGAMPCASADCIQVDICHRNITANYITPNNINLPPLALCYKLTRLGPYACSQAGAMLKDQSNALPEVIQAKGFFTAARTGDLETLQRTIEGGRLDVKCVPRPIPEESPRTRAASRCRRCAATWTRTGARPFSSRALRARFAPRACS